MIYEVISSLSALPHRLPASHNERRAAEYLRQKIEEMGYKARLDPFGTRTTFSCVHIILYLGFAAAAITGAYFPLPGTLAALLFAALFFGEHTTRFSPLSSWAPRGLSHNVVSRVPSRDGRKNALVLVAHYDTAKTGIMSSPGMRGSLSSYFTVSLVMIAALTLLTAARLVLPDSFEWVLDWAVPVPAAYVLFMCFLLAEREIRGEPVNGSSCNASGVAVVMELARRLKDEGVPKGWGVVVLFTGGGEAGPEGMIHFLQGEGQELAKDSTRFLVFEGVGGGKLSYIKGEGMLFSMEADPELLEAAAKAGAGDPRFSDLDAATTGVASRDALAALARGYKTLRITALGDDGMPKHWHWRDDRMENVDLTVASLAADLGWNMVRLLFDKKAKV